ncbi:hydrogenase iron-sulfur subunit [SCandidatus Aminicenantes bacterium Aminicenantia_JdfR_composite]|jgi:F420-non-reducing hydrogenase iron-sulfur subunit|nr:hydrogenase iron-sulfur subunit [SCandidatus Aminicenantes bacterium Aminicenantia_JdfR_composite]MCP2596922.1 hydrogenase iron-sulfur subunit [Candidatus Aminicenantes bacterium AC-335-G13]MCP2598370.1 hydrogenase iron-sulfur subunit [Candidatus Aminicenantes bacterium AC-335-L06]MCP2621171.1 hydrogenase iron-sulfur subunit [Candidatus Aminicenantes bacterium AC-334-E05]
MEFEPKIIAFVCNWCTYAAADLAGTSRIQYPPNVRIIRLMCSGAVDPIYILKALLDGADGVLIGGCHPGDCHYQNGNYKARRRFAILRTILRDLGIPDERVRLEWISASEGKKFADTITNMVEELKKLGPSPFKTMWEI